MARDHDSKGNTSARRRFARLAGAALAALTAVASPPAQEQARGRAEAQRADVPEPLRLRARVLTEDGVPIAGAGVLLGERMRSTTADALTAPTVRTDAAGRFELPLPRTETADSAGPPTRFLLIAAPGRATAFTPMYSADVLEEMAVAFTIDLGDLRLPEGVTIRGRVRDQRGRPIAGARVMASDLLTRDDPRGPRLATFGHTDAEGAFELHGACPSALELVVDADGCFRQVLAPVNATDPLVIVMAASGFVSGRVRRGDAIATVSILYELDDTVEPVPCTADGTFRTTLRRPSRYRLIAHDGARLVSAGSPVLVGSHEDLVLDLGAAAAPRALRVTAVDAANGEPIRAFEAAVLWPSQNRFEQFSFRDRAQPAGQDGVALLPGPCGDEQFAGCVQVRAHGYAPGFSDEVRWKEAGEAPAVQVKLARGATITGDVVDFATGTPLPHAVVRARPPAMEMASESPWPPDGLQVRADEKGRYRIEGLAAGGHDLTAWRANGHTGVRGVRVRAGQDRKGMRIGVPAGVTLTGSFQGLPEAVNAWVHVAGRGNDPRLDPRMAFFWIHEQPPVARPGHVAVARDGTFRVENCLPGSWTVSLLLPGSPRSGGPLCLELPTVRVGEDGGQYSADVAAKLPIVLSGKLEVPGGFVPAGRLVVVAEPVGDTDAGWPWPRHPQEQRALSTADATFSLRLLPGAWRLRVVDVVTGVVLAEHDRTLDLAPQRDARLDLTVPLAEVRVTLEPSSRRELLLADRLEIATGEAEDGEGAGFVFGVEPNRSASLSLADGRREVTVFVPAGTVRLTVRGGVRRLSLLPAADDHEREELGSEQLEVEAGETTRVTIRVAAPSQPRADER